MMDDTDTKEFRVRVWFRHDNVNGSSTYIIHNLPHELKDNLINSVRTLVDSGGYQPYHSMSIDSIVSKMVADSYQFRIHIALQKLLEYVYLSVAFHHKSRAIDFLSV